MLRTFGGARIVASSQLVGGDVGDGWLVGNGGMLETLEKERIGRKTRSRTLDRASVRGSSNAWRGATRNASSSYPGLRRKAKSAPRWAREYSTVHVWAVTELVSISNMRCTHTEASAPHCRFRHWYGTKEWTRGRALFVP